MAKIKNNLLNYMQGELKLMPKKEVETICYNLYKKAGKEVLREDFKCLKKDKLISNYISLRNKMILA